MDVATVSNALGHSAISTTCSVYLHAFQDANARASEVIADVLDFGNKKPPAPEGGGKCRITISSANQQVNKKASNSY